MAAAVPTGTPLAELLTRTNRLVGAWREVLAAALDARDTGLSQRESLVLDACSLAMEHGQALRVLLAQGLQSSALALIRVQHEALLRAAWLMFCATESEFAKLLAPQSAEALKRANSLPMAGDLLVRVEQSEAPAALKRGLREFREQAWAGANSYTHAGYLAIGRLASGHPEPQLIEVVQSSNAHSYGACMLMAGLLDAAVQGRLNALTVAHPGCMRRA